MVSQSDFIKAKESRKLKDLLNLFSPTSCSQGWLPREGGADMSGWEFVSLMAMTLGGSSVMTLPVLVSHRLRCSCLLPDSRTLGWFTGFGMIALKKVQNTTSFVWRISGLRTRTIVEAGRMSRAEVKIKGKWCYLCRLFGMHEYLEIEWACSVFSPSGESPENSHGDWLEVVECSRYYI